MDLVTMTEENSNPGLAMLAGGVDHNNTNGKNSSDDWIKAAAGDATA